MDIFVLVLELFNVKINIKLGLSKISILDMPNLNIDFETWITEYNSKTIMEITTQSFQSQKYQFKEKI